MNAPILALFFTCLLVENAAQHTTRVGESISLMCLCQDNTKVMSYWYKQVPGRNLKLMSTIYMYDNKVVFEGEFNNSRFSLDPGNNRKLMISDLRASDSATYFCALGDLYEFTFCEGTTVSVEGSGPSIQILVRQSETGTIQPGSSKTLSCTVHTGTRNGEQGVYWFKDMKESHSGLIHTHGGSHDWFESENSTETHTCVYKLPAKSLNASGSGILDCAVASCGHILLGKHTKLQPEDEDFQVLVYLLSGALAFTTILALFLAYMLYRLSRRIHLNSASSPSTQFNHEGEGLHYAAVRKKNEARKQHDTYSECVYSSVKL